MKYSRSSRNNNKLEAERNRETPVADPNDTSVSRIQPTRVQYRSIRELAAETGLSERSIRNFIKRGELPYHRPDRKGKILIKTADWDAFMERCRVDAHGNSVVAEVLREFAGER